MNTHCVGKPVQHYTEMPKPAGKSRVIFYSKAFTFASLIRAYRQCKRNKKWKNGSEEESCHG